MLYKTNLHNNLNNKEVSDDISLLFYIEYKENETQILVEQQLNKCLLFRKQQYERVFQINDG